MHLLTRLINYMVLIDGHLWTFHTKLSIGSHIYWKIEKYCLKYRFYFFGLKLTLTTHKK